VVTSHATNIAETISPNNINRARLSIRVISHIFDDVVPDGDRSYRSVLFMFNANEISQKIQASVINAITHPCGCPKLFINPPGQEVITVVKMIKNMINPILLKILK
jgi:hypothetical protein